MSNETTTGAMQSDSMTGDQKERRAARPHFVMAGELIAIQSEANEETVIAVKMDATSYQSLLCLDWADYDGRPVWGRADANALARWIIDSINEAALGSPVMPSPSNDKAVVP